MPDTGTSQRIPLILVVDDDWMNREVLEAHLRGAGYEVRAAHSGGQALDMAFETPPDLVLLDVRMQDMNGYDVCRQLKAHGTTRRTPVMIVTALDKDTDRQKALAAGADDFIAKPYTSMAILVRIRNLLRIKRLEEALAQRDRELRDALMRHVDEATAEAILAEIRSLYAEPDGQDLVRGPVAPPPD